MSSKVRGRSCCRDSKVFLMRASEMPKMRASALSRISCASASEEKQLVAISPVAEISCRRVDFSSRMRAWCSMLANVATFCTSSDKYGSAPTDSNRSRFLSSLARVMMSKGTLFSNIDMRHEKIRRFCVA